MPEMHIKINGQEKSWGESFITPKDILVLGDKPEPYNGYIIFRTRAAEHKEIWNQTEDLHKQIKVQNEDVFDIEYKPQNINIHYSVNGEGQETAAENNKLTVAQILERANFTPVDKFQLFNQKTNEDYKDLNQTITIGNGDKFLALSAGPTPVA